MQDKEEQNIVRKRQTDQSRSSPQALPISDPPEEESRPRRWSYILRLGLVLAVIIICIFHSRQVNDQNYDIIDLLPPSVLARIIDSMREFGTRENSDAGDFEILMSETFRHNNAIIEQSKADYERALREAERDLNSAKALYQLISKTANLGEYEEALQLGQELLKLIPDDEEVKEIMQIIQNEDKKDKEAAKIMERDFFDQETNPLNLSGLYVFKMWTENYDLPLDLVSYQSQELRNVIDGLKALKKDINFQESAQRVKILCGIDTGQIEGLYDLSLWTKRGILLEGPSVQLILDDKKDKVLLSLPKSLQEHRADSISQIINDNIEVLSILEEFATSNEELTISFIKQLHRLFTNTARYIVYDVMSSPNMSLIRRGKWKLFSNYVIDLDYSDLIGERIIAKMFAPPSKVESAMQKMMQTYEELKQKDVLPQVLAAWLHVTFVYIHPFDDGNGRVARALASLILLKNGLLPFSGGPKWKNAYISALQEAHQGNLMSFIKLIETQQQDLYNALKCRVDDAAEEVLCYYETGLFPLQCSGLLI